MNKLLPFLLFSTILVGCSGESTEKKTDKKVPEVNVEKVIEMEVKSNELHEQTKTFESDIENMDTDLDSLLTL